MSISKLAGSINESPTLALNEKARLLRVKGDPVIHLGGGEPKNKAPITAVLGSAAKLRAGDIKYAPTDGLPSLKKAIIRYTEDYYGRLVSPDNVIVSTGAKQSIYNLLFSLVNPQDEVIILAPYWVSYPDMIKMVYGIPVIVTPEDGTFQPRMEEIEESVSSYTKVIIINSPNNPSGMMYPDSFIADIVDFCERKGIYLIFDDIYHRLTFDGQQPKPAYEFTDRDIENSRVIVVNGISKLYGLTGFRIGWTIASRRLVEVMTIIQSQVTSCPSVVSQAAAEGALTDVTVQKPNGTFYCLPDFRAYKANSLELAKFLLDKALVVTVPGVAFGMEGYLRLSYCGSVKDIKEGVERLKWALDPNAPNEIYIGDRKLIRDWL
jgi:aspartate aminotransferase